MAKLGDVAARSFRGFQDVPADASGTSPLLAPRETPVSSSGVSYMRVPGHDGFQEELQNLNEKVNEKVHKVNKHFHKDAERMEEITKLAMTEDVTRVQLLGQEMKIDDRDATIVIVFPRAKPLGTVDANRWVEAPLRKAHMIFERQHNHASRETMNAGFESFQSNDRVPMQHFQKVVRAKLLQVLRRSGFKVVTFPSIDGDEVFAKISLNMKGQVIKQLAQWCSYVMPFTEDAYKDVKPLGRYQGNKPMWRDGKPVPAFGPYQKDLSGLMQDFRTLDQIRIIEHRLHSWVSLEQLKREQVITNYFPVASHSDIARMNRDWATCTKIFELPKYGTKHGLVRNHFGEEIAFFFRWFAFYTQMLFLLAVLVLSASGLQLLVHYRAIQIDMETATFVEHISIIGFSGVMVVWATIFNQLFKNRMAQAKQDWGMKDFEEGGMTLDRADYRPDLEGTWTQALWRSYARAVILVFCGFFIVVIYQIEQGKKNEIEHGQEHGFYTSHGSLFKLILIRIYAFGWTKIAPKIADWQNHRTQARWDDALTQMLSLVKIFVTLWNFVYVAFIKKYSSPTCGSTLAEAAAKIYPDAINPSNLTAASQGFLDQLYQRHFTYTNYEERACIYGCFPVAPYIGPDGSYTNCYTILHKELFYFFWIHIISTIMFLLWPVVKVKLDMNSELGKAAKQTKQDGVARQYSWLQYQAKCPPYAYNSWGGSRVEDFLECAIGYALLTCFGILYPMLAVLAFVANVVEYRLLAYRMVHVTCRPLPRSASGIGSWQQVFETISATAIVVNAMLICFVMYPMRTWRHVHQLAFFVFLEHVLLGVRAGIDTLIPDEPRDVKDIADFNAHFKSTMVKYPALQVPPEERYEREYGMVDLGLLPGEGLDVQDEDIFRSDSASRGSGSATASTSDSEDHFAGRRAPWCACVSRPQDLGLHVDPL